MHLVLLYQMLMQSRPHIQNFRKKLLSVASLDHSHRQQDNNRTSKVCSPNQHNHNCLPYQRCLHNHSSLSIADAIVVPRHRHLHHQSCKRKHLCKHQCQHQLKLTPKHQARHVLHHDRVINRHGTQTLRNRHARRFLAFPPAVQHFIPIVSF